jgi:hypothetical protein
MNTQHSQPLTIRCDLHLHRQDKGRLEMRNGKAPVIASAPAGRVPRLARLMALALRFEGLLRQHEVHDYAELARLGHVTRARATQIMNLLHLAPDIQEAILFLPPTLNGRDPVPEWQVRPIAAQPLWSKQRKLWKTLASRIGGAA